MRAIVFVFTVLYSLSTSGQEKANIEVVYKIFEAFNEHKWDKMLSYYQREAVFEDPAFSGVVSDHQIIARHHSAMVREIPDLHDEIKSIMASGRCVVVEFIASGTAPNGEHFKLPICTIFTFENGRVIKDSTYYDRSTY